MNSEVLNITNGECFNEYFINNISLSDYGITLSVGLTEEIVGNIITKHSPCI